MFNGFNLFSNPGGASGGGGSSYPIVATYGDLPLASSVPGIIYVVTTSSGTWLINRKEAGMWFSTGSSWTRLGSWLDAFKDSNFTLYNNADNSKMAQFDLSKITTLTTRNLTLQDASGTVAYISDIPEIWSNQDYDDSLSPTVYVGKTSNFSNWQVKKVTGDAIITLATVANNPLITSYSTAWTNRLTLTYN